MIEYLILLFPTLFEVVTDYFQIKKDKENHKDDIFIRVLFFILVGFLCMCLFDKTWYQATIYSCGLFIITFDYLLNIVRVKPIQHKGTSKVDQWFGKFPFVVELFIKGILFWFGYMTYYHLDSIIRYGH